MLVTINRMKSKWQVPEYFDQDNVRVIVWHSLNKCAPTGVAETADLSTAMLPAMFLYLCVGVLFLYVCCTAVHGLHC